MSTPYLERPLEYRFCHEERLVPVSLSFSPYQAVYRFKYKDDSVPIVFQKRVPRNRTAKGQLLQVSALLHDNIELSITAAKSMQHGNPVALLDWVAMVKSNGHFDDDVIMHTLDRAQNVIHEMFMKIVTPITVFHAAFRHLAA